MSSFNDRLVRYGQRNMTRAIFWELVYRLASYLSTRGSRAALQRFADKIQIGDRVARAIVRRRIVSEDAALLLLETATTRIAVSKIIGSSAAGQHCPHSLIVEAKKIAETLGEEGLIKFVNQGIDLCGIPQTVTGIS